MANQSGFIFKVLLISAGLAILLKYGGPSLSIPATPFSAIILVIMPTVIMAIALGIRYVSANRIGN